MNCDGRWGAGWKKPVLPLEGVIGDLWGFLEDIVSWKGVGGWGIPSKGCYVVFHMMSILLEWKQY